MISAYRLHKEHRGGVLVIRKGETKPFRCSTLLLFTQALFEGMVRMFQSDNEMRSVVMTDKDAREQATRHFFKRGQRQARKA